MARYLRESESKVATKTKGENDKCVSGGKQKICLEKKSGSME